MNYVWEAALQADAERIPREKIRYVPVDNGSPYTEIVRELINEKSLGEPEVLINPLYRFADVCSDIFSKNLEGFEQTREIFFRVLMQYMVQLDLRQGLDKQEYDLCFLIKDILQGVFGKDAAFIIRSFEKEKLRQLLRLILKLYQCGSSVYLFREVMRYLYPDSLVYASNEDVRQILIYVGRKETETNKKSWSFCRACFFLFITMYLFSGSIISGL